MKFEDIKSVNIGGIPTACVSRYELAQVIGDYASQNEPKLQAAKLIFSANGHSISEANTDKKYMKIMNSADLVHADGQSVVQFSKWVAGKSKAIPERTATTDMIHDIPNFYQAPIRHFLLGGKQEVVASAANLLAAKYPNFILAGVKNGYFSQAQENEIVEQINQSDSQVLWVGLGKPKEQEFCIRNKDKLTVPIVISCGGCYNFVTGDYQRAPAWMQNHGLEWLHRAMTRPKHLLWRYITTNPHAIYSVLKHMRSA
ncbi:WecB/TagA/CpsF family glycosyltransferase [Catenovulum maritimum]|uniref:Glycosyl transferase n=1 Tax=Catenovulum maritimum TaxID=1513271 RepID=A0A0J8GNU4_9ALTE|nr:WecB/TagA/CpsF family glycosyltransferase [Catenovulum maritimum]KMT64452.1 glycosyl transferase [Catenovulum maritimum]